MHFSVSCQENVSLKQIKKELQQKREELQHLKLKQKLHSTYLLWEEGGSKERIHIETPGNKIIFPYPASALFPRRQDEEQNT